MPLFKRELARPYWDGKRRKGRQGMKGVNKKVIEINEPESEYIDKVLVFLRQKDGHVNVARARQEAEGYVNTLVCWRRLPLNLPPKKLLLAGGLCLLAIAAVVAGILLL